MTAINAIKATLDEQIKLDEQNRLASFKRRRKYYEGFFDKQLKADESKGLMDGDNARVNFARMFVDKGVAFLFGKDVGFDLINGKETPEEKWLDAIWRRNGKMSLLQKLATNGAICGTAFLKIHWRPGIEPKLVVIDPETITVKMLADDIDEVHGYVIAYASIDPVTEKSVQIRQVIERDGAGWLITDQRGHSDGVGYQTIGEQRWPFAFSPIVHCQNMINTNEFWGISDIEDDLVELIDKYNFVMSNMLRTQRYHAHPITWISGVNPGTNIDASPNTTLLLPKDATIGSLEMRSDMVSSLEMATRLKQAIHELARVPEVSVGKVESVGQLSGIALEILYQPLLEKTEAKRVTYGELIVETNRRLLAIDGKGENNITTLHWQPLLPKDVGVQTSAALAKRQLGVSGDTLIQELGYNPDDEKLKRGEEVKTLGEELMNQFDRGYQVID